MKINVSQELSAIVSRWRNLIAHLRKNREGIFEFFARLYNDLDCSLYLHALNLTTRLPLGQANSGDFLSFFEARRFLSARNTEILCCCTAMD